MDRAGEWVGEAHQEQRTLSIPNWLVVLLLVLVVPLSLVAAGTSVLPGDVAISRFVQSNMPAALDPLVAVATVVGLSSGTIAIACTVAIGLLARGHRRQALLVLAATIAQAANIVLKLTLESPRPTSNLVHVSEQTSGFGFPSGHTMGTTVPALILFYVATTLMAAGLRRRLVQAGLLLMPLVMGVARIETGAHWPSDVLGAWLWGTLTAITIVWAVQRSWSGVSLPVVRPARSLKSAVPVSDVRRGISQ